MKILVTGGAGFIGSNFIHYWMEKYPEDQIINFDKLTYAGHRESLKDLEDNPDYQFIQGDIADEKLVGEAMKGINVVVHFAAESHVDRSIVDPLAFVRTNVMGTAVLLNAALNSSVQRFHHVSTDEVYGHLGPDDHPFTVDTPYNPRTPYSASKAGSDHLVRAFYETFGLPITISNCANNYGPFQDPEKLIPRFITNLIQGQKVPLMGEGENIREWLHVEDHCRGLDVILKNGKIGETYLLQGEERTNKAVTLMIFKYLGFDESMIEKVEHRLGHDFRYANDGSKLMVLGWTREHGFEQALEETVNWYKENEWWWKPLLTNRPNIDRSAQKSYG